MAKVIDGDDLIVSSSAGNLGVDGNIWIDTTARTFEFAVFGQFTSFKEGCTEQALYSKFIKLWETSAYNQFPFPMYAIDAKSGQFEFGFDGSRYSDWGPANDTTRQALRDGGWNEYKAAGTPDVAGTSATGDLARVFVGIPSLGEVNAGAQLYYQRTATEAPQNFTFTDEVNEGIQVYGDATVDATTTTFDNRTFFKAFVREQGYTFKDSVLADTGQTSTGAFTVNVLLDNAVDSKITADDSVITTASSIYGETPSLGVTVSYYTVSQNVTIDSVSNIDFRIIIDGDLLTLPQIYTKVQWLLRQNQDINLANLNTEANADGAITGKTADSLLRFEGDTLICSQGVFIENLRPQDRNSVEFTDFGGTAQSYDFIATLQILSNNNLTSGGTGYYVVYITDSVAGTDDYGTSTAIILDDNTGSDIAGTIASGDFAVSIDYDGNTQGGRVSGDIPVTVVAGNKGVAKPVVQNVTIGRNKTNSVTLTAEQDRAYTP